MATPLIDTLIADPRWQAFLVIVTVLSVMGFNARVVFKGIIGFFRESDTTKIIKRLDQRIIAREDHDRIVRELEERLAKYEAATDDEEVQRLVAEAREAIANENYGRAVEIADKLRDRDKDAIARYAEATFIKGSALLLDVKYPEALAAFKEAVRLEPENALYLNEMAFTLYVLGRYMEAMEYYEKALAIDLKALGEEHSNVARAYNNLGETWRALGEYEKAIEYFDRALPIVKKALGEEHPNVAICYNNLGAAWDDLGENKDAIDYYNKALSIYQKAYDEEHPSIATCCNNLGEAWRAQGENKKAIEFYNKALAIDLKTLDEEHPNVAIRYNNLGLAWWALGDSEKALGYFEKALPIIEEKQGHEHPYAQDLREKIAKLKSSP